MIEGLPEIAVDMPHHITQAILYRSRIDSFNELPEDKRPPRDLWMKPHKLKRFLDSVWDTKTTKESQFIDFDLQEAE